MSEELHQPAEKHVVKRGRIAGFNFFEARYPPNLKQARHTHASASFSFVLAGAYLEKYGQRSQLRRPSTIVLHPPQESHAVDFQSEVKILSVHVDFQRLGQIRQHCSILDSPASSRSETISRLGHRIYQEFRRMDNVSALAIEGLVLEILAEAARRSVVSEKRYPGWLERTKEYLRDNFSENLACEDVAKVAGVHPVHLARVFRRQTGCTIGEYIRLLRIEFARRQLSETNLPISQIAFSAGFADHSHLIRIFKNHFGQTPSEYRKNFTRR